VLGEKRAEELSKRLWSVEEIDNVTALIEAMAKPA